MIVATIFESVNKVRLHSLDYLTGIDHTITVAHGCSISITLSEDRDNCLIMVKNKSGRIDCSMFADCIEKGNY